MSASTTDVFDPDSAVALERRRGARGSEAALGLPEAERGRGDGRPVELRSGAEEQRGRVDERDGGETLAERPGDERELDRAELRLGRADLEHAEVDQVLPDRFACRLSYEPVVAGPSSDQLANALGEHAPVRLSAEAPRQSWGRARIRSAMIDRWIWPVPPYTEAARE